MVNQFQLTKPSIKKIITKKIQKKTKFFNHSNNFKHMKKLSSLIVLGIVCSMAIAKPSVNVSNFDAYSTQMHGMAAKYVAEKQYINANKTIDVWLNSYQLLPSKEKENYHATYASIMYNRACALSQTNELFQALKALKEAVKAGFNDSNLAQNDPNLSPLKSYDEFTKIINSIKI